MVTFNFAVFKKYPYIINHFPGVKQDLDTFTSMGKFDMYRA